MSFQVITEHPVADDSPDHICPWGTARDNSRNHLFNERLFSMLQKDSSILDLGCSGGGFVKDCIDAGYASVGIEGSDYSKKSKRAEWATIPGNLFTADITHPFQVRRDDKPFLFDIVTAWEVMEHISAANVPRVLYNARSHLKPRSMFIVCISTERDAHDNFEYHQSIHQREWWDAIFKEYGFEPFPRMVEHFQGEFVRSRKNGAPYSFNEVYRLIP